MKTSVIRAATSVRTLPSPMEGYNGHPQRILPSRKSSSAKGPYDPRQRPLSTRT